MLCAVFMLLFCSTITTKLVKAESDNYILLGETKIDLSEKNTITSGDNWRYDKSTNTLYLSGVNLKGQQIYSNEGLNIVVTGKNYFSNIEVWGSLKISGKGTLILNATDKTLDGTKAVIFAKKIEIKNCTINLKLSTARDYINGIRVTEDSMKVKNAAITSKITGTSYYVGTHISVFGDGEGIYIEKSIINLTGTANGIDGIREVKNSTITIDGTKRATKYATSSGFGGMNMKIYNSTFSVKVTGTAMCPGENGSIRNSKVTLESTGDYGAAINMCEHNLTITNSTVKTTGNNYGAMLYDSKIKINSGKLIVKSTTKEGMLLMKGAELLVKGGTVSVSGKTYGIEVTENGKVTIKGGTLTVSGKKAACNKVSILPANKSKYKVTAGSSKNKAKTTTKLSNSNKYIYIKKK